MSWTAEVTEKSKDPFGILLINVRFVNTDTGERNAQTYRGITEPDVLKKRISEQIAFYENVEKSVIEAGPVDLTPAVPEIIQPTQEQIDQAAWLAVYRRVQAFQRLSAAGVLPQDQYAALEEAQAFAEKGFRIEYLPFV